MASSERRGSRSDSDLETDLNVGLSAVVPPRARAPFPTTPGASDSFGVATASGFGQKLFQTDDSNGGLQPVRVRVASRVTREPAVAHELRAESPLHRACAF